MDKLYLKRLVVEAEDIDPQNEILENENSKKRFAEMAKNLNETIEYLDTCDAIEFWWATEVLEELSEHFRSQDLIDCIERNSARFNDYRLQAEIKIVLEAMKTYLQNC